MRREEGKKKNKKRKEKWAVWISSAAMFFPHLSPATTLLPGGVGVERREGLSARKKEGVAAVQALFA